MTFLLRYQPECPVVIIVFHTPKKTKSLAIIDSRIEDKQWGIQHDRVKVVKKRVGPEQGPRIADPCHYNYIVFIRFGSFNKCLGYLLFMEGTFQCFSKCIISSCLLKAQCLIVEVPLLEVVDKQLEKINMGYLEIGFLLGQVLKHKTDIFSHREFFFWRC